MRYLLILLGGLILGAVLTVMVVNTLQQRSAYPRSVMRILQHQVVTLRQARRHNDCGTPAGKRSEWSGIANLALEIEPAFSDAALPPAFAETSRHFVTLTAEIAHSPATACADFDQQLARVNDACDDCHGSFR
ncbi:MAG: hypothetical protein ABI411_04450 [Tahibacter sp.]